MKKAAALLLVACSAGSAAQPDAGSCACSAWGEPSVAGPVGQAALVELSGLAASVRHAGVLFTHNDSGDKARFFSLTSDGAALGEFSLVGATATDWEAIAVGPCPNGTCVFVGDFGDNAMKRADYAIYRVAEPAVADAQESLSGWERFVFGYPGGAKHNAEAILVHPTTGRVFVITKDAPKVFAFPGALDGAQATQLTELATLAIPATEVVTDASVNPCGDAVLVRTYHHAYELHLAQGAPFESIFSQPLQEVPLAVEEQGEAIAYVERGRAYVTSSEHVKEPQNISRVACP